MELERLQREGRLAEKEMEAKRLELKAKGLIDSVRLHLDPFEKLEEIDIEVASQEMTNLTATLLKYREICGDIKNIRKALGRT